MSDHAMQIEPRFDVDDIEQIGAEDEAETFIPPVPRVSIQAFCETADTAKMLQVAAEDRRMARAHTNIQSSGIDGAISFYREAPSPNLIIVELIGGPDSILENLARLAEVCDSGTKVLVIGHVNDVLLYRELVRRGVSEYLVAPLSTKQVLQSIAGLYGDPQAEPLGRVLAFVGAKGGSGSSTVAHNSAWMIANNLGTDAIIADLDLPFGTAALDFNQDPMQGIAEAVYAPDRLDDVLLDRQLAKCTDNLSLFSAPGNLGRDYDLEPDAYDRVLDVVRANVPAVILDLPHMWNGWVKHILLDADEIVITAEPDLANLRNAKNIFEIVRQGRPNDRPPRLVLNRVGVPKRPEISPKDFAEALNCEPAAIIAFDPALFGTAANNGQMIQEMAANAKPLEAFAEIAKALTGRSEPSDKRRSLLAPLMARLGSRKKS